MSPSVLVLFLSALVAAVSADYCLYPSSFYNTREPWHIPTPDYELTMTEPHIYRRVRFEGSFMSVEHIQAQQPDISSMVREYQCVEEWTDRYIVAQRLNDEVQGYRCLAFIVRQLNVVQMRMSTLETELTDAMCSDDRMPLQPGPMVYYYEPGFWNEQRNKGLKYIECPLKGGHVANWLDENGLPICEQTFSSYTMESECKVGEGIMLLPRNKNCQVPHQYNILQNNLHCLATWEEGDYQYMVTVPSANYDYTVPCIRIPKNQQGPFKAYVFLDGACASGENPKDSKSYIQLQLSSFPVPTLCSDNSPKCNQVSTCDPERPDIWSICRWTCDTCKSIQPEVWEKTVFPSQFQGKWLRQTTEIGPETVLINSTAITIPSMGTYNIFDKTNCFIENHSFNYTEYTLVWTSDNGCSPRVTNIQFWLRNPNVLSYSISNSELLDPKDILMDYDTTRKHWEISRWAPSCNYFNQQPHPLRTAYQNTKGTWFNLVKSPPYFKNYEKCNLPHFDNQMRTLTIYTETRKCTAKLNFWSDDEFQITLSKCYVNNMYTYKEDRGQEVKISEKSTRFACLASFQGDQAFHQQHFLLTKAQDHFDFLNETTICWEFKDGYTSASWYYATDCNTNKVESLATVEFSATVSSANNPHISLHWTVHITVLILTYLCIHKH